MADPATKAQLLEALQALYHHPDDAIRKQADRWLGDWQRSTTAWSIADNVLHDANATMEAQYFCAQTLRTKVQRDFEELPADAADGLRTSLVTLLLRFSRGAPPVRTQLCLALAAIPPHMPGGSWGDGGVIPWLAQRLGQDQSGAAGMSCLLEMLTVIPQEAGTFRDAIRPERRREYRAELVAAAPTALNLLTACLQNAGGSEHLHREVLGAFGSWMRLGGGAGMDGAALCQHPLVAAALAGLESTEHFEAAVDAVCELVWCTVGPQVASDGGAAQPLPHMMPLVQLLVAKVFALRPRFSVAAARARDEKVPAEHEHWDDDEDTAKDMARCFAEVGEAFVGTVAQAKPEVAALVEAMIDVAGYPDDAIAAISFNFWHSLAVALQSRGGGGGAADDAERERRRQAFVPAYEKLVGLICGRVRYPAGHETMHREERAEFKRARYAVADTLEDAAMVVGGARILELMVEPLQAMSQALSAGSGSFDWRTVESALYCIRAVHKYVQVGAHPVMTQIMAMLPSLPSLPGCSPQLLYTAALMVGAYADWLVSALDSSVPQSTLPQLLTLLHATLLHEESSSAGALALRHICDSCRSHLVKDVSDLKALYELVVPYGVVPEATASSQLKMEGEDVEQIVEAVTLVMSAAPADQLSAGLDALLNPLTSLLEACCGALQPGASTRAILPLVDRFTIILRSFQDPGGGGPMNHASLIAQALGRCWPLIETLLEKTKGDQTAMETVCKAPRYALRTAGRAAAPLLPLLLDRLPQHFKATRQCTLLYVGSELVKTFGDDPGNTDSVGMLFQGMLQEVLPLLSSLDGFTADPFMADDAFLLVGRAISYCPAYVYRDPAVTSVLLDTALHGLLVQQREASMSVLAFFLKLLDPAAIQRAESRGCQQAAANLEAAMMGARDGKPNAPARGSELLRLMLAGALGGLPRSRVRDVSDAMLAVLLATQGQGLQWLMDGLNRLPGAVAAQGDKERFWQEVRQAVGTGMTGAGPRLMEDALTEMSDLCRRNQRALETVQQAMLN